MEATVGRLSEPSALDNQVVEGSAGVDLWLNQDLQDFDDDDIGRSILEFTVPEFVEGSPDDAYNNIKTTNRLQCISNGPTSCGEGPINSGAVYGGSDGVQPIRIGAHRSYSTNDLELLLETSMSIFPPLFGDTGTAPQDTHMRAVGGKAARSGLALESVPEGAPSQGGPLPGLSVFDTDSLKSTNAASPGSNSVPDINALPTAAQTPFIFILSVPSADGDAKALPASASAVPITQFLSPLPPVSSLSSGNLRHIPSSGTLSVLMDHTLHLSPEGADDSQQQHLLAAAGEPQTAYLPATTAVLSPDQQQLKAQSEPHQANLQLQVQEQHVKLSGTGVANTPVSGVVSAAEVITNSIPGWGASAVNVSESTTIHVSGFSSVAAAGSDTRGTGGLLRKVQSALELGAWRNAAFSEEHDGLDALVPGAPATGQKMIGRLTQEERLQRILRYRQKRNSRNFNREIKYQCRKTLADSRPRVCGRFARNDDPKSVMPYQTKKAQRRKVAADVQQPQQFGNNVEPGPGGQPLESGSMQQLAAWQLLSHSASIQAPLSAHVTQQLAATGNNSATTSSGNSDGSGSLSAGTAAAAIANAHLGMRTLPYTAAQPLSSSTSTAAPAGYAPSCVMPCLPAGMIFPYVMPSLPHLPMSVPVPLPGGLPMLSMAAWDPSQLQHHYHVVNAAAQAAAQGVYAHLGISHAAGPHTPAPGPILSPYPATQQSQQLTLADGCVYGNAPTIVCAGHGLGSSTPVNAGRGPVPAPSDVPPRLDTPLIDSLFAQMDAELNGATAHTRPVSEAAGEEQSNSMNVTCMTVDN